MDRLDEHIHDYKLRRYWQKLIAEFGDESRLKSQSSCGARTLNLPAIRPGIVVMANSKHSALWGFQHCFNAWACPECSAVVMSRYSTNIACAIEALKKQGQVAFMVTLGIPHTHRMSCKQAFEILQRTWANFIHHGNKHHKSANNDAFSNFCAEVNCTYRIRVCEMTWGQHNGWNPHYHCLFFVDEKHLQDVLKWQKRLSDSWKHFARKNTLKVLADDPNFYDLENYIDILYERQLWNERPAFYISTDKKGKVIKQTSSLYICGWGADDELTGLKRKKAHKNRLTPIQILEKSMKATDEKIRIKYAKLYREFALATIKKQRMCMSNGLRMLITEYKKTHDYIELYKKKLSESPTAKEPMKVICWFTTKQWSDISELENLNDCIVPEILQRARLPDGKKLIEEYLLDYGVDIRDNPTYPSIQKVEAYFNKLGDEFRRVNENNDKQIMATTTEQSA